METSNWTNTKAFEMRMWNICAKYAYRFKFWNGVEVLRDILVPLLPLPKVVRIKWSQITSLYYFISILFKFNVWTVTEWFYSLQIMLTLKHQPILYIVHLLWVHIWWNTFIPGDAMHNFHRTKYSYT